MTSTIIKVVKKAVEYYKKNKEMIKERERNKYKMMSKKKMK